jgi:1-acyl-sn-glycerol-3-phosphate acyltransferase
LLRLSRSYPEMENKEILDKFFKEGRPAMFVANHQSWMDIPFLGVTVGWKNYKLVSKKELAKVPILGTGIVTAGNIMLDRDDRRSQINTLRQGIDYLKVSFIFTGTVLFIIEFGRRVSQQTRSILFRPSSKFSCTIYF